MVVLITCSILKLYLLNQLISMVKTKLVLYVDIFNKKYDFDIARRNSNKYHVSKSKAESLLINQCLIHKAFIKPGYMIRTS